MECLNCGKETRKWGLNGTKYCNKNCAEEYRAKLKKKYFEKIKCAVCGNEFIPKSSTMKYCSNWCKYQSEIQKRSKKPKTKICKFCGKEFMPYTSLDKFCSANCRNENVKSKRSKNWGKEKCKSIMGEKNPCYRNGLRTSVSKQNGVGLHKFRRNYVELKSKMLNDDGFLHCEFCDITDKKLEAHHIIFRSEKPNHEFLHEKINIILVCVKCHNLFHKHKNTRNEIVKKRELNLLFGNDVLDK